MPLGDVARNPDTGDTYRLDKVGNDLQWVELGDDEAAMAERVAKQGAAMAFAGGAAKSATLGLGGPDEAQAAAQEQQFPLASTVGSFAPDIALGAGGLSAAVTKRIAQTGAAQVAKQTAKRTGGLIRRPSNILGRTTTTGSAVRMGEAALEAVPGLNIPLLAQKAINARRTNRAFAEMLDLSGDAVERAAKSIDDIRPDILTHFDDGYRSIYGTVGENMAQADARAITEGATGSGYISKKLGKVLNDKVQLNGDDIHALRSELSAMASHANTTPPVITDIKEYIKAIDEIIEQALAQTGDEVTMKSFRDLNAQFSVWAELRKGRGLGADGMINPRTADGRFMRAFGDRYAAGEPVTKNEKVNEFLALIREGSQLDVGIPSSGTAERAIGAAVAAGIGGAVLSD